jgi:sensor histidine kinase YesM
LLFLALAVTTGCAVRTARPEAPEAEGGLFDLSGWDLSDRGNVSLDGDWAFYWDALLSPGMFDGGEPTGYFRLPSGWAKYKALDLPSHGVATYRLEVKAAPAGLFGILVPNVYSEYALWANGTLLHACGSFAGEKTVYLHPQAYNFYSAGSGLEIVLQVRNDDLVYGGGVGQSIRLGIAALIHKEHNQWAATDLFLISICAFMGLFFLVLRRFNKRSAELRWIAILCFSVALRNLLSNTTLLMQALPALPFWVGSRLVMLTIPAIIISMLFYTRRLYADDMPKIPFRVLLILNALYMAIVLTLPSTVFTAVFFPYLLTVGAACALGCLVSVRAVMRRKKESVFFLAGMLLLTLGAILDSLVYLGVLNARYMLSAALFGFIIIQVILLSKRYSEAYRRAELLSGDLQASLDRIMQTETAYMTAQMKPHFLYNALNAIADNCETNPAEAGRLILALSKYLRQTLDYDNLSGIIPLKKELELVYAYTAIEKARFPDIDVRFDLPEPLPALQVPPLTLQPLVENAVRHGLRKKRGGGRILVGIRKLEGGMELSVEDNGAGIPDTILKKLGDMPAGSVSIGIYNINTRLLRLYGSGLTIHSKIGEGTRVSFTVPCHEDACDV